MELTAICEKYCTTGCLEDKARAQINYILKIIIDAQLSDINLRQVINRQFDNAVRQQTMMMK